METIIVEDHSMAASLSRDFGLVGHSWTPFREGLIHPSPFSRFRRILRSILTCAYTPARV